MAEAWVTYIAKKRARKRTQIKGNGTAQPLQGETESESATSFVKDERTGLLLPEGARAKKRQPGFGAEWDD